ncbi:LOW QUALITY PROTEIN: B-cell lymphoma 3 protein [Apodemus sylvaticus]|uniref:LOW QUALITY PROTEIN: B-cell lymphoma 3 protein n=1 Tax=Apodemus sylvaticus TaxID=10129 RepID=UPI0022425569|nr:LOW QUALITY PROTEIN: B-cell lymphoma 3 protein [Apodemus sylvaticus]
MPRCPAGAMDEGPVDLRTRPKGTPGAALPLRKRPLRPASPEPAATRSPAGPLDALRSSCDIPAVPGPPHCVARPEALYYQGPLMPLYAAPTTAPHFPLLNLPAHPYSMMCPVEHPLSADIAVATRVDEDGDTPLHIAVVQNNMAAVYRILSLFKLGSRELDVHNNLRQTPLHLAVITTLPDIVQLLVTAGASPMALDRHGQTAVHLACEHRSPSCLQALLDNATPGSVDLEARNYEGLTALHVAVNTGCQEAVLLLLERGADIDAVDIKSGRSPLIHAVENNSLNMVQLLLLHGANVNAQMYSGSSALHSASGRGLLPLVRTLVRSGADSGLKNCHNDTPLMVARSRRVIDILRGKASRAASGSQPEPSPDQSATNSPESSSRLSSNGLQSSPSSSPSLSPSKDVPGFPVTPQSLFLPTTTTPAFLPFPGVLRGPGRPVPPSPAPGSS